MFSIGSLSFLTIMKKIALIIFFLGLVGCKKNSPKQSSNTDKFPLTQTVTPTNISMVKLLALSKELHEKLEVVPSFELVHQHIDSINQKTSPNLKNTVIELNHNIVDFYKSIPTSVKNNQVLSRINQLRTYALLLENSIDNPQIDTSKLTNITENTLKSYNKLITQLNETENTLSEDFKKELEKAKIERDSLNQSEVAPLF